MSSQYEGIMYFENGVDAGMRLPFKSCTLQRSDGYNYSQPITQNGVQNYTLGEIQYSGGIEIPLLDAVFVPVFRWILEALPVVLVLQYFNGCVHVYRGTKVGTCQINNPMGGSVSLSLSLEALDRKELSTTLLAPVVPAQNQLVAWSQTGLIGAGISTANVCGWDLSLDWGLTKSMTGNCRYNGPGNIQEWYRKAYGIYTNGLSASGSVKFLHAQPVLYNAQTVALQLKSNFLYLTSVLWQPPSLPINGNNQRLCSSVAFNVIGNRMYRAVHT